MDIQNELAKCPVLKSLKNKQVWEMPNDYFESFADKFMARLEQEEMNPEKHFSDIPSDYFETFLEKCKDKLEEESIFENAPILASIPKVIDYQDISPNYFEELSERVTHSLEKEELEQVAPILHSLPKRVPYADLPAEYFLQNLANIQAKIQAKMPDKSKGVAFFSLKYSKTWASLAAMMFMIIGIAFLFYGKQGESTEVGQKELSFSHISNSELAMASKVVDEFDVNTLVEELELNSDETPDLEGVSDEELSNYLKDVDISEVQ